MKSELKFLMFGGFLGAGKTTAIRKYVSWLSLSRGLRTAVITNDQASGLVDSELMKESGIATDEIAGGCFCCKSDLLMQSAEKLINDVDPDVILGEPVGSCTDLISTVSAPLEEIFQAPFVVGPLSVIVDPLRVERFLKRDGDGVFDESDIDYIYGKQLEEAQVIVINKRELLSPVRLQTLENALRGKYPAAAVFAVSARKGDGLEQWWEYLETVAVVQKRGMEMDYQRYADAEARMGWLNGTLRLRGTESMDVNAHGKLFTDALVEAFQGGNIRVAHFKLLVKPMVAGTKVDDHAVIQWVDNTTVPEFTTKTDIQSPEVSVIVNLRAESEPEIIRAVVEQCFALIAEGKVVVEKELTSFAPSAPKPVHRV